MKKQILSISPVQTAKVLAVMYFLMSLPMVAFMFVTLSFSDAPQPQVGFLVFLPFLYLVLGFIFTALGAWVYNLVAKWVGGVEYTSSEGA